MTILKTESYLPSLAAVIWVCNMELVVQFGLFFFTVRACLQKEVHQINTFFQLSICS